MISAKHSCGLEVTERESGDDHPRQHDGGGRERQELDREQRLQGGRAHGHQQEGKMNCIKKKILKGFSVTPNIPWSFSSSSN